jgi:hypothetical protein
MAVFDPTPVLSDLPGVRSPLRVSEEHTRPNGQRFGFSVHSCSPRSGASGPKEIVTTHKGSEADFYSVEHSADTKWRQISRHRVYMHSYLRGVGKVAEAYLSRYGIADGFGLKHAWIWCIGHIQVESQYQRLGIATAFYAHAKAFGFPISPAPVLTEAGQKLWSYLDPNITQRYEGGRLRLIRTPELPLHEDRRDDAALDLLTNFNARAPCITERLRDDPSELSKLITHDHAYEVALLCLKGLFRDPAAALTRLLLEHGDDKEISRHIRWRPALIDDLIETSSLPCRLFGKEARKLIQASAAIASARQQFLRDKLIDYEYRRDRWSQMHIEWTGFFPPNE